MICKEFGSLDELNKFLQDYPVKDCIINTDEYPKMYRVWVDYVLIKCPHCNKKTPSNGKYCTLCGENFDS